MAELKPGKDYVGVGVGVLIRNDKGEMLLGLRTDKCRNDAGKWSAPGGCVEFGETLAQAAVRETREEIGLAVDQLTEQALLQFVFTNGYTLEVTVFTTRSYSGEMIETDDVLAELGKRKNNHWIIGFALEATNPRENALQKLRAKNCDYVIVNSPQVIGSDTTSMEIIDPKGIVCKECNGTKTDVASDTGGEGELSRHAREMGLIYYRISSATHQGVKSLLGKAWDYLEEEA